MAVIALQHLLTCSIKRSIRSLSLFLLTPPAIHKRVGTMIAKATQTTAPLILIQISSACTCISSRIPRSIFSLWTDSQCLPARYCQFATVLSSNLNACTIACVGHPYASNRMTITKSSSGFRIPSKAVPALALNVFPHVLHL
jgi:hypothetical protein